jgi:hypothetical protein
VLSVCNVEIWLSGEVVPQSHDHDEIERWNDDLETEFEEKLLVVAQWCDAYVQWCKPEERKAWLRFAAFLRVLGGGPPR